MSSIIVKLRSQISKALTAFNLLQYDEAIECFHEVATALVGEERSEEEEELCSRCLRRIGCLMGEYYNDYDQALLLIEASLVGHLKLLDRCRDGDIECHKSRQWDVAESRCAKAHVLCMQSKYAEARELVTSSLSILREVCGTLHPRTLYALILLAEVSLAQGLLLEAQTLFLESQQQCQSAITTEDTNDNENDIFSIRESIPVVILLAKSLCGLGSIAESMGRWQDSLAHFERALDILMEYQSKVREKQSSADNTHISVHTEIDVHISMTQIGIANCLRRLHEYSKATAILGKAGVTLVSIFGEDNIHISSIFLAVAELSSSSPEAKYIEANMHFSKCIELRRAKLGNSHPLVAAALAASSENLRLAGNFPEASKLCEEALSQRTLILGDGHPDTVQSLIYRGRLWCDEGSPQLGKPYFDKAHTFYGHLVSCVGEMHPLFENLANESAHSMQMIEGMNAYMNSNSLQVDDNHSNISGNNDRVVEHSPLVDEKSNKSSIEDSANLMSMAFQLEEDKNGMEGNGSDKVLNSTDPASSAPASPAKSDINGDACQTPTSKTKKVKKKVSFELDEPKSTRSSQSEGEVQAVNTSTSANTSSTSTTAAISMTAAAVLVEAAIKSDTDPLPLESQPTEMNLPTSSPASSSASSSHVPDSLGAAANQTSMEPVSVTKDKASINEGLDVKVVPTPQNVPEVLDENSPTSSSQSSAQALPIALDSTISRGSLNSLADGLLPTTLEVSSPIIKGGDNTTIELVAPKVLAPISTVGMSVKERKKVEEAERRAKREAEERNTLEHSKSSMLAPLKLQPCERFAAIRGGIRKQDFSRTQETSPIKDRVPMYLPITLPIHMQDNDSFNQSRVSGKAKRLPLVLQVGIHKHNKMNNSISSDSKEEIF